MQHVACASDVAFNLRRIEQGQFNIFDRTGTRQQIKSLKYEADAAPTDASQCRLIQLRNVDSFEQVLAAARAVEAP